MQSACCTKFNSPADKHMCEVNSTMEITHCSESLSYHCCRNVHEYIDLNMWTQTSATAHFNPNLKSGESGTVKSNEIHLLDNAKLSVIYQ